MKRTSKALSIVLSVIMILSCVLIPSFAEVKTNVIDGTEDVAYGTNNNQDTLTVLKNNNQQSDIVDGKHQGVAVVVPKTNYTFMRTSENEDFRFTPTIYFKLYQRTWREWLEHTGFMQKDGITLKDVSFAFSAESEDCGRPGSTPGYPTPWKNKTGYLLGFDGYFGSMKGTNRGSKNSPDFTVPEGYTVCDPQQNGQADVQLVSGGLWGLGWAYLYAYDMTTTISVAMPENATKYVGDLQMDISWAGSKNEAFSLQNKIKFNIEVIDLVPLNKLLAEAKKMNDQKPANLNQSAENAFAAVQSYINNTIYANCGTRNEYSGLLKGDKYVEDSVLNGDGGYVETLEGLIATAKKEMIDGALSLTKAVIDDKSISDYKKENSDILQTYQIASSKYALKETTFYSDLSDEVSFDTLLRDYNTLKEKLEKNGYDFPNVAVYKRQVRFERDGNGGVKPPFKFRVITAVSKADFDRIIQETSNIVEVGFIAAPSAKVNAEGYENARKFVESGGKVGTLGDFKHGTTKTVYINAEKPESYMHFGCMMQGLIVGETINDDLKASAYVKYKRAYIENGQAKIDDCYVWYDTFNEAPVFTKYESIKQAWIAKFGV